MASLNASILFPELANPQHGLAFPQTLSERYQPKSIDDFAGLESVKKAIHGWLKMGAPDCGFLFVGATGLGKTSMALAVANAIGGFVHHIPARECTVDRIRQESFNCHYFPPPGYRKHVIVVDEADLMSPAAQEALLSKLDGTDPVPDTVWIFTCNGADRFEDRFLGRNHVLKFSQYGMNAPIAALLEKIWKEENGGHPAPNFARIAKESNNNARESLMRMELELMAT